MPFMLMIMEPEGQRATRSPAQGRAVYRRMLDYAAELKRRGLLVSAESLRRPAVRFEKHGGRGQVVDGPFTEAKEFVGGFFLLDCKSREEALALAEQCPASEWVAIEIRETGPCYD